MQFDLSQGQTATFLSNPMIQNILARVVGGNPSIIDGLIQVTGGTSNLYLINPAGIVFGANANLNVPAAFTATTANGLGFGCGNFGSGCQGWFNSVGSNDYANLNATPNGFAFTGIQPGAIVNAGNLTLAPGQSLTLLGGTVINTGTLSAPGGTITMAAVPGQKLVRISQQGRLLSLEFQPLTTHVAADWRSHETNHANLPSASSTATLPQLLTGGNLGSATKLTVHPDGTVQLSGSGSRVSPDPGSTLASGNISVAAFLDLPTSTSANSLTPQINILGSKVELVAATLNASAVGAGGTITLLPLVLGKLFGLGVITKARTHFPKLNLLKWMPRQPFERMAYLASVGSIPKGQRPTEVG